MTLLDDTRGDLDNDLFDELGTNVSIYTLSGSTTSKWGDESFTYNTASTVTGVPFNQEEDVSWQKYGTLSEEYIEIAIPYTTSIDKYTIFFYDGIYYGVKRINSYPLIGGNLVTTVRLYKHETQSAPVSAVVYIVDENTNLLVDENNNTIIA